MYGLRVTLSHNGISKACKKCFYYHKKENKSLKRDWHDYVTKFSVNNLDIDSSLIRNCNDGDQFKTDNRKIKGEMTDGGSKPPDEFWLNKLAATPTDNHKETNVPEKRVLYRTGNSHYQAGD
jgi:hypothetical protein